MSSEKDDVGEVAEKEEFYEEIICDVAKGQFKLTENVSYVNTAKKELVLSQSSIRHEANQEPIARQVSSKKISSWQKFMILCLLVSVIVIAVIMSVGFIFAFMEISKVKSATDYSSQVSMKNMTAILASLEDNELLNDIISKLQEEIQLEFYFEFNLLNSTITEMLESQKDYVDMLYLQLIENVSEVEYVTQRIITALAQGTGAFSNYPASTCAAVIALNPSSSSGYYWIRSSNSSAMSVYCDMTRSCGNITGGWMRVAELDMTVSSSQCLSGLRQRTDSNIRTCVGTDTSPSCSSVIFPTAVQYSMVCGKIIAYQVGTTNAFEAGIDVYRPYLRHSNNRIDANYVDGVSLTHGSIPKEHIWTFAAALNETYSFPKSLCRCIDNNTPAPPTFVGEDYFCDTGNQNSVNETMFYSEDPLWDGAGCGVDSTCCSFNNPPWFFKQLPQPTTDDIEMRVCRDENSNKEDIALEKIYICTLNTHYVIIE